jgi:hypothetical protein
MPDNKVTVHIWLPTNMGVLGEIAKFAGVGHAAISLRHNDTDHYITWMAQGSPFGGFEIDAFRHIDSWTKAQDRQNMVQFFNTSPPTHTVRLKTKQQPTDQGLDSGLIEQFWQNRLNNRPKYAFLSLNQNCTGCCAEALCAGGLENYVPAPKNWFIQDAVTLLSWVQEGERRLGKVVKAPKVV